MHGLLELLMVWLRVVLAPVTVPTKALVQSLTS